MEEVNLEKAFNTLSLCVESAFGTKQVVFELGNSNFRESNQPFYDCMYMCINIGAEKFHSLLRKLI